MYIYMCGFAVKCAEEQWREREKLWMIKCERLASCLLFSESVAAVCVLL